MAVTTLRQRLGLSGESANFSAPHSPRPGHQLLLMQDAAIASEQFGVASAQLHKNLSIAGQYLGELVSQHHTTSTSISLVLSPQYIELRTAILRALQAHPEARKAVAAAIQRMEAQAAQQPPQPVLAPAVADAEATHVG